MKPTKNLLLPSLFHSLEMTKSRLQIGVFLLAAVLLTLPERLPFWTDEDIAAKKALGILLAVIVLWSTEAIPIYATALLIPLPAILQQVSLEGKCGIMTSLGNYVTDLPCTDDKTCQRFFYPDNREVEDVTAAWQTRQKRGFGFEDDREEFDSRVRMVRIMHSGEAEEDRMVMMTGFMHELSGSDRRMKRDGETAETEVTAGAAEGEVKTEEEKPAPKTTCQFTPLSSQMAAKKISSMYFAPIAFQFLGIFSIASAMKKMGLDRKLASIVLGFAGTSPKFILLGIMLIGWLLSMWITNVAAAVVILSLVSPLLHTFEHDSFPKCVLLGIAFSCNIAGMASTIASPQNLLANSALENAGQAPVTFIQWLVVGGVTSFLGVLVAYLFLLTYFKPTITKISPSTFDSGDVELNSQHLFVILVAFVTIGFWCVGSIPGIKMAFGDVALIGAVPVALFLWSQILTKNDFLFFSWDIIILVGGGLALGFVVTSSRLLQIMTSYLIDVVGNDPTKTIWIFGLFTWFFSNFISHTVAAAIIMPVIASSGSHPQLAVLLATLLDSGACALPISGFPNALALSQKDSQGRPFLATTDYLKTGVPVGLMVILLVNSVGNFLALMMGME